MTVRPKRRACGVYFCPTNAGPVSDPCAAGGEHTPQPVGYLEWYEWVREMAETHRQKRCPNCGLWSVWVRR